MSNEDYHDTMSWADNVSALIHRSQCRLTDLHIFLPCTPGKEHAYTKLLALLAPTLVVLGLTPSRYSPDTDKLIRSLTRTKSSPGSLPHLEHLQLSPRYTHDEDPLRVDLLVDTIATTLMSLRDGDLAEQWHAPLLARVSVISRDDALIAKLRTSCLDFLLSQGLEVVYARDRGDGSDTLGAGWHGTWSDRFESNRETIVY
ncbi:hypothetical protein CYLTODRAFT_411448 [Cylindrobasidium torrendii FP15055 ss-10]|uniref:Uncharacterized protein n=1 Tax=Cylindrobasidium torrendii FP15055 ss-10 TaxID=1314674 RepID=A0A0D7B907_9AGAR|nr:hypothetical protein CYLTODRAFT_411448 [Cylindrobasidium torrendii FP15055 ss-10]